MILIMTQGLFLQYNVKYEIIPSIIPTEIKKLHYFSDNCGGQYKNFKVMVNLTFHFKDFNRLASWIFFAACHGKSPCDGVGAV